MVKRTAATATQRRAREEAPSSQHAFTHAPAALRIFRFAADTAPRVLELAHVSKFLRECAVDFGSADAALPGALRCDYARWRYFELRAIVIRNAVRCPWLAVKLLTCRSRAPVPAAALAPDVTRHDVDWGAEGARRHEDLAVSEDGSSLQLPRRLHAYAWAQGAVSVTSGKHFFSVTVSSANSSAKVGWVDLALSTDDDCGPGDATSLASGATLTPCGFFHFGTAPLSDHQSKNLPRVQCPCTVGCLLDADAGEMTVFVDGEPLAQQCAYTFPTDREWSPTVGMMNEAIFSNYV
jgi:hypothetical protein